MKPGDRLKMLRSKSGLTQTEVAKRIGINNKTLSGYENNVSTPDTDTLQLLAKFYNTSTDFLICGDTSSNKDKKSLTETLEDEFPEGVDVLMRAKEELTPAQKKKMIELMHLFLDSLKEEN